MKEITIYVPDDYENQVISVISGITLVARKNSGSNWFILKEPCNRCGECCKQFDSFPFQCDEKGWCPYLEEFGDGTYECKLGAYRPLGCCCDNVKRIPKFCSVRYEEINGC